MLDFLFRLIIEDVLNGFTKTQNVLVLSGLNTLSFVTINVMFLFFQSILISSANPKANKKKKKKICKAGEEAVTEIDGAA